MRFLLRWYWRLRFRQGDYIARLALGRYYGRRYE